MIIGFFEGIEFRNRMDADENIFEMTGAKCEIHDERQGKRCDLPTEDKLPGRRAGDGCRRRARAKSKAQLHFPTDSGVHSGGLGRAR